MTNKTKKIFNTEENKLFFLYIIAGVLLTLFGVVIMPIWGKTDLFFKEWGYKLIKYLICFLLLLYLFAFLLKKIKDKTNGVIKTLTVIEFSLLAVIAVCCVLSEFIKLPVGIGTASQIFGLALWLRGVVEIFHAYYHQKGDEEKYGVGLLAVAIAFVSFGMFLILSNVVKDVFIVWLVTVIVLVLGIILIFLGIAKKPESEKKEKTEKPEKAEKSETENKTTETENK